MVGLADRPGGVAESVKQQEYYSLVGYGFETRLLQKLYIKKCIPLIIY